jgi:hypothetical protein
MNSNMAFMECTVICTNNDQDKYSIKQISCQIVVLFDQILPQSTWNAHHKTIWETLKKYHATNKI